VALAGGVGVATGVIGTTAAVIGLGVGWVARADPLLNGSAALVARSLVWHLYARPNGERCPSAQQWNHLWNTCWVPPA
jgi:hypothetical protein